MMGSHREQGAVRDGAAQSYLGVSPGLAFDPEPPLSSVEGGASRPVYAIPVDWMPKQADAGPLPRICEFVYSQFERILAALVLLLSSPILLIQAIVIRIETPGPALFVQRRTTVSRPVLGRDLIGRSDILSAEAGFRPDRYYLIPQTFNFVKFRTMYADARQRWPELYDYRYSREDLKHSSYKKPNWRDPRITPIGRILRNLTVDELPNFWCVVTGKMRLVGPRPELPEMLPNLLPKEMMRFSVKPGITGLAQINGRGNLAFAETIAWDLEYVFTRSLTLDLKVLLRTFWLVLMRQGAF